jgi:seryl-tRNA synthetase
MLDIKFVRDNPDKVEQALKDRGSAMNLDEFLALEKKRRELLSAVETLKSKRNAVSQEISKIKKNGGNADELIAFGNETNWIKPIIDYAHQYAKQVKNDYGEYVKAYKSGYFS